MAVLHAGVVDDRQPVVEDEAADDGVGWQANLTHAAKAATEASDRSIGATTTQRPRASLEISSRCEELSPAIQSANPRPSWST